MVVCMVVRVRNLTERTFYIIQGGDPFYGDPRIGDEPAGGNGRFKIAPGFDAPAEGLVVPWTTTSRSGLIIGEVLPNDSSDPEAVIRVVIGPNHRDREVNGIDWLRMHIANWEPVSEDKWLALGKRHLLGAIGTSVDVELSFEDGACASRPYTGTFADPLADAIHFERESFCASRNTIFLNVYDLAAATSTLNQLLCNTLVKTLGAFHAAVEVYGEEWSFYRQADPSISGVLRSRIPRNHSVHVYRQSINCGETDLTDEEVWNLIVKDLSSEWLGGRYDLIHCNCIHFCEELLVRLGGKPVPSWVKGLHETGAAIFKVPWPLSGMWGAGSAEDTSGTQRSDSHEYIEELHPEVVEDPHPHLPQESSLKADSSLDQAEHPDVLAWMARNFGLVESSPPPLPPLVAGPPRAAPDEVPASRLPRRPEFLPTALSISPTHRPSTQLVATSYPVSTDVHETPRSDGFVSADEEERPSQEWTRRRQPPAFAPI
mmetsp:Transcript_8840/g.19708  ORF Transcript_8840/g.19708 Transcript_8840/m.19708 type:complete len:487 (-) Transcript_8840:73-1533(-)